ncbi:hypothetical protein WEI85_38195 [Actinomycetes bacterium KLBMP 9797]
MNEDDMIRAALTTIADRAPNPGRLAARLTAPERVDRRRRNLLMVTGAAAATTAVAGVGGAALLSRRGSGLAPGGALGTSPESTPGGEPTPRPGNRRVPMRYRTTWLPDGFIENSRRVTVRGPAPGAQMRSWTRRTMPPRHKGDATAAHDGVAYGLIHLGLSAAGVSGTNRRATTVNGKPAWVATDPQMVPQVVWQPEPGVYLALSVVHGLGDQIEVASRMASSVVADTSGGCEVSLDFGWLPPGRDSARQQAEISGTPDGWEQTITVLTGSGNPSVTATLRPAQPAASGGQPATLRGRSGLILVGADRYAGSWAQVDFDNGRQLWVNLSPADLGHQPATTREDLVRIVDELRIGPVPYTGWLGR